MKISNSKKQLAKIIHENGGWAAFAGFAAQDRNASVTFFVDEPWRCGTSWEPSGFEAVAGFKGMAKALPNWHQTILSREEYFHLYPVAETAPEPVAEAKPTIEQLAVDYRNRKDYADRKQQEADAAKSDAETKLAALVAAGKAHGLVLSVAGPEPELVITDWRDLQVGDEVEARCHAGVLIGFITEMEPKDYDGERPFRFRPVGDSTRWCTSPVFRFISRPAKGDANA